MPLASQTQSEVSSDLICTLQPVISFLPQTVIEGARGEGDEEAISNKYREYFFAEVKIAYCIESVHAHVYRPKYTCCSI